MPWKLFRPNGYHDVLAVGPGRGFNPGSPANAQELVDQGLVRNLHGEYVNPFTSYESILVDISPELWTVMAGWAPTAPR